MTDKQLEEYTRLKIQEATKELQDKYDRLDSASKEYKYYLGGGKVVFSDKDELTGELKRLQDKYEKATEEHIKDIEKINNFKNSSLLTRIGIAIRGEL